MADDERTEFEVSVGEALKALDAPEPAEDAQEAVETPDEPVEGVEGDEAAETPVGGAEDVEGDEQAVQGAAADEAPTLPDAHVRSLKAYGWSDDEIQANLDELGNGFLTVAEKVHNRRIQDAAQWAQLGRAVSQPGQQQAPAQQPQQAPQAPVQLTPLDVEKLREKYGNDELIEELVGPVNGTIAAIQAIMPSVIEASNRAKQTEQETLGRQLEGFFQSGPLKDFGDVYGESFAKADAEQYQRRSQVLQVADAMIAGARYQGRTLTTDEALELAHAAVSNEFTKTKTRQELQTAVKKRSGSLTVRPSKTSTTTVPSQNRTELEARARKGLASVFGD